MHDYQLYRYIYLFVGNRIPQYYSSILEKICRNKLNVRFMNFLGIKFKVICSICVLVC